MNNNNSPQSSAGAPISFLDAIKTPAIFVPVLIAFVLLLTTLASGLQRDDFMHRALLQGHEIVPGHQAERLGAIDAANGLFSFTTEDSNLLAAAKAYGNAPWWADDELKVNFWRPLSALTHWLDYQLWPESPALMHLHSLIWNLLIGCLFGLWLVRLGLKGLSLWLVMGLYALDASHVHAITWLANRNILLATTFGLMSLIALQRWDTDQSAKACLVALLGYGLSLFSAEAGLSFVGVIFAYLFVLGSAPLKNRVLVFVGFVVVTVLWRLIYSAQGYGSLNSGFYLDPINDFPNFLTSLLVNGPIMLYEQLIRVPSLSMLMSPAVEINQVVISMIVLLITLALCLPLLKRNKLAVFGIVSAIIAVAPACATVVTGGRLMFVFGLGVCISVGLWYTALIQKHDWFVEKGKLFKGASYLWSFILMLAIVGGTGFIWYGKASSSMNTDKPKFNIYTQVLDKVESDQVLVLLNPPLVFEFMYLPLKADYYGIDKPGGIISIAPGLTQINFSSGANNQIIASNDKGFLISKSASWYQDQLPQNGMPFLFKRVDRFFVSNHKEVNYKTSYRLSDAHLVVQSIADNNDPNGLIVTFNSPLDSGRYVFLGWDWEENEFKDVVPADLNKGISFKGPF